jgi:hypothetical protein
MKILFFIVLFNVVNAMRLFPFIIGGRDKYGCVMPYRYCNYTSTCEPFNIQCNLIN